MIGQKRDLQIRKTFKAELVFSLPRRRYSLFARFAFADLSCLDTTQNAGARVHPGGSDKPADGASWTERP